MHPLHIQTPVSESMILTEHLGKNVSLKMECMQPCGSFKLRGIGRLCQDYLEQDKTHLVSSSGGNAGFTTAYIGRKIGMDVTVFVPTTTPDIYVRRMRSQKATVHVKGDVWDESNELAQTYSKKVNGGFVHPFDHPTIWAGHSTIIDEIVQQAEKPDVIITAVGGGGLLCGILQGLHQNAWGNVPVITAETEGAASFKATYDAKKLITLDKIDTIALTLGARCVTKKLLDWLPKHTLIPVTVTDHAAAGACIKFADDHRVLVEPACGTALSLLYDKADVLNPFNNIMVIVCGGIGVSLNRLQSYINI